jgi:hypothetical protein
MPRFFRSLPKREWHRSKQGLIPATARGRNRVCFSGDDSAKELVLHNNMFIAASSKAKHNNLSFYGVG